MGRLRLLALAVLLLLLQQLVVLLLPPWARPDLLLVLALGLGLRSRGAESLALAFALGFGIDALSGAPLGLYALLRGTACAATRFVDRALFLRSAAPWLLYAGAYALADSVLLGGILRLFVPDSSLAWPDILARAPLLALATALFGVPVFWAIRRADGNGEPDGAVPLVGSRP